MSPLLRVMGLLRPLGIRVIKKPDLISKTYLSPLLTLLIINLLPVLLLAQGLPYSHLYSWKTTGASYQNWDLTRSTSGYLYAGNDEGKVLEYDGVSWRHLPIPGHRRVRSLACSEAGELFVGSIGEIGVFTPDSSDALQYSSLTPLLPPETPDFQDVWDVQTHLGSTFFLTDNLIIRYKDGIFDSWSVRAREKCFLIDEQLFFTQTGSGFSYIDQDLVKRVPGAVSLGKTEVVAMLPIDSGYLLCTEAAQLWNYNPNSSSGQVLTQLNLSKNPSFTSSRVRAGVPLGNHTFSFSTANQGIFTLNETGEIMLHLAQGRGLASNQVFSIHGSPADGLWFANAEGIHHFEMGCPVRFWGKELGLQGNLTHVYRHHDQLYAGGGEGTFLLEEGQFVKRYPKLMQTWSMGKLGSSENNTEKVVSASSNGIYQLGTKANYIGTPALPAYQFLAPEGRSDLLWAGLFSGGIALLSSKGAQTQIQPEWLSGENMTYFMAQKGNELWFSTDYAGVGRVKLNPFDPTVIESVGHFDTTDGLPGMNYLFCFSWGNEVYFANERELVVYDEPSQRFVPSSAISIGPEESLSYALPGEKNDLWIMVKVGNKQVLRHYTKMSEGRIATESFPQFRIPDTHISGMYLDGNQSMWLAAPDGLFELQLGAELQPFTPPICVIRKVVSGMDSTLFEGRLKPGENEDAQTTELPHAKNALTFHFASPSFHDEFATLFSYRLVGFDTKWSNWGAVTTKEYTNLPPSTYVFQVIAKDAYGTESKVDSWSFTIKKPWYRTGWAWTMYLVLGGIGLIGLGRIATAGQRKRNKTLESEVGNRTTELHSATLEALEAKAKAEEASHAKSAFLANMSHEIRTPLNGVIGITDLLGFTQLTEQQQEYVRTIRISGENLLRIINEILDFSKIEAGKMELETSSFKLRECIEEVLDIFSTQCSDKGINLAYRIANKVPNQIRGDQYKLRQVLLNLLGNAMKFTEQGEVFLLVKLDKTSPSDDDPQKLKLAFSVKDTGIGISKEQQTKLFDSFAQADASITRKFGGTGLGLMISKKLIEMMGGEIEVVSQVGMGSNFNFSIEIDPQGNPTEPTANLATDHAHLAKKRVLIVEDGDWSRMALVRQFQDWGMIPVPAETPEEALELLETYSEIHLVVTDMVLENSSGEELARYIRKDDRWAQLPIILLSSVSDLVKVKDKRNLFNAAISKPVKYARLLTSVLKLLKDDPTAQPAEEKAKGTDHKEVLLGEEIPLKILIAEDNEINQMLALRMFSKIGYQPDMVENGKKAVDFVLKKEYDLVFMDVQMPEMDGLEATELLHTIKTPNELPKIIAMTANALEGDRQMCLEAGMDDYLSKPFRISDLIEVIKKYGRPA